MGRFSWVVWLGLSACAAQTGAKVVHPPVNSPSAGSGCGPLASFETRERLPFGFYSVPVARFEELASAGVTMVGPYYGERPSTTLLDAAQRAGLGVLYPLGLDEPLADAQGRASLVAQIDAVSEHPAVVGWYILPEELRPWSEAEMLYAARVRAVVRAHDHRDRPVMSYQPNHRGRAELAGASASFDIVLRGLYANYVGAKRRRAWVREGADTIATAAAIDQTPWAVLEMFEQPSDPANIHRWVRHDVYASLVSGARGVLVFSGWPRAGFPAYEAYLLAYLEVATELNGPVGLATPLLRGAASRPIELEILGGPSRTDAAMGDRPRWVNSVAAREVLDQDSRWIYVVNSDPRAVRVRLPVDPTSCPPTPVVGPAVRGDVLELPGLGVCVLRIQSPRPTNTRPTRPLALP